MKIYISDKFITSDDFSPDEFLAYVAIRKIMSTVMKSESYFISMGVLSHALCDKQMLSRSITSSLLSGIVSLMEKEYIKQLDNLTDARKNEWIFDFSKLYIDVKKGDKESYYSMVDSNGVKNIVEYEFKERLSLLRFYCYLMTTVHKTGSKVGVGFTPYYEIADNTGFSENTVSKYMLKLQEVGIIYAYAPIYALRDNETGELREISHTYGSIENKDKIVKYGKEYEFNYGEDKTKIKSPKKSSSRSAAIKYNYILQDIYNGAPIRYSPDEMKEIYDSLVQHNERYKDNDCGKLKDLSIFNGYEFYRESEKNNEK